MLNPVFVLHEWVWHFQFKSNANSVANFYLNSRLFKDVILIFFFFFFFFAHGVMYLACHTNFYRNISLLIVTAPFLS